MAANKVDHVANAINVMNGLSRCPLTNRVMRDPVILIGTGCNFERDAITAHLRHSGTDPMTGRQLTLDEQRLVQNPAFLAMIQEWLPGLMDHAAVAATNGPTEQEDNNNSDNLIIE